MTIRIIFKSGYELTIKCDGFELVSNNFGQLTEYKFSGITENKPLYLDWKEIVAVVRVVSDEIDSSCGADHPFYSED